MTNKKWHMQVNIHTYTLTISEKIIFSHYLKSGVDIIFELKEHYYYNGRQYQYDNPILWITYMDNDYPNFGGRIMSTRWPFISRTSIWMGH